MKTVANPCCCITLRRGSLIIGILDIALGILGVVFAVFAIFGVTSQSHHETKNTEINSNATLQSATKVNATDSSTTSWIYAILSLFLVLCILQIAFGSILILGINREKLLLLKGWIVFKASGIIFSIGTLVAFILLGEGATFKPNLFDGLTTLFNIYCMWVIYTLLSEIKRQNSTPVKPFRT